MTCISTVPLCNRPTDSSIEPNLLSVLLPETCCLCGQDVHKIIQENSSLKYKEYEDIEFDISELNNKTLWKLAEFLKGHQTSAAGNAAGSKRTNSQVSRTSGIEREYIGNSLAGGWVGGL